MKRRKVIFLSSVLLNLLIVQVVNIVSAPNLNAVKWLDRTFFYNMDLTSTWLSRILYPLGISTDPEQVIIGDDAWLYLGDRHENTRSVDRRQPTDADIAVGKGIGAATEAWNTYLAGKGVKRFKITIAPNKVTIYPEHLPVWARPPKPNVTDALLAGTGKTRYLDLRRPLLAAKSEYRHARYYETDTHWNFFGAGIAFRHFAEQIGEDTPELQWPDDTNYEATPVVARKGGDPANFLRLTTSVSDTEPLIRAQDIPVTTAQFDFDTNQILYRGGNAVVYSMQKPVLVKSDGALNNQRVL